MKKIQYLSMAIILLLSISVNADDKINSSLNLDNPDVRKCLLEASEQEGWELKSVYLDANEKIVMVFDKGNNSRTYKSK